MLWPRLSVTVPGEYDFFPSVLIVVITFDELQPDSESLHLPVIVTSLLVQIFGLDDTAQVGAVLSTLTLTHFFVLLFKSFVALKHAVILPILSLPV